VGERVVLPLGQRLAAVEIVELETAPLAHGVRLPSAELLRPGLDSLERTAPDPAFFGRSDFVPERLVQAGVQGFERGQGVAYVEVAPVRWNPATGELERIERVRVRLVLEPTSERPLERERVVPEWEDGGVGAASPGSRAAQPTALVGGARQAEPFKATQLPSVLGSPVAYVIVTNDAMAPAFQQLADWKTQSGVPAVVRTISFIKQQYPFGADDAERVRLFIRDAYSRWGTKWPTPPTTAASTSPRTCTSLAWMATGTPTETTSTVRASSSTRRVPATPWTCCPRSMWDAPQPARSPRRSPS
jgi:hypothetical protein